MNYNKIYVKYSDELGRDYINKVIQEFEFIGKEFYEDRNIIEILDVYFLYELNKRKLIERIDILKSDINKFSRMKDDLKNYIIDKLRSEKKLIKLLLNKDRRTLYEIKELVDINREFNEVDRLKFEDEKRNRGMLNVNMNN